MTMRIKKDDEVMVIAGKDKGHIGRVVNVQPDRGRVMVEGAARAKRHLRPTSATQQGGIIEKEMFIDVSNVQLICKSCGKPTRIGHQGEGRERVRVCKKCGAEQ